MPVLKSVFRGCLLQGYTLVAKSWIECSSSSWTNEPGVNSSDIGIVRIKSC